MKLAGLLDRLFTETQEKVPDKVRRSPRWEGPTREVIRGNGCMQDVPMLTRYRLFKTPYGAVFVHHWHRPDSDRDCHDHPWWFGALVLSGGYTEEIRHLPGDHLSWTRQVRRRRFSCHAMPLNRAHRVIAIEPRTWTLLLVGPKRQDWSFYVHEATAPRRSPHLTNVTVAYAQQLGLRPPQRVPWQAYVAQGGNPDPFNC